MSELNNRLHTEVEQNGSAARGRQEILAYYEGKRLSASQAIKAKCYSCTGYYADGRGECFTPSCPLYGHMPFNKNRSKKTKVMTEEQKVASAERMKNMLEAKKEKRTRNQK